MQDEKLRININDKNLLVLIKLSDGFDATSCHKNEVVRTFRQGIKSY